MAALAALVGSVIAGSPKGAAAHHSLELRTTLSGGQVMITAGIPAMSPEDQARVLTAVRGFDAFTDDNDPWGEHDMGALDVVVDGPGFGTTTHRIFFKHDYYDPTLSFLSDDPADPSKTVRVLTIMLADEY